jgi:hypothetical protein
LKTSKKKSPVALAPFETGQVWQMEKSNLRIGLIGKTLVHYKHYKEAALRAPVSLAGKVALEKYLIENKAVLVQTQP